MPSCVLQMRVIGERGKVLGTVDAVEHDALTRRLVRLVVRHGVIHSKQTRVSVDRVKGINHDSVVLEFSRASFKRVPTLARVR